MEKEKCRFSIETCIFLFAIYQRPPQQNNTIIWAVKILKNILNG